MPLAPQITNTPSTIVVNTDFTITSVANVQENTTFYQGTAPAANAIGDIWFDTSNGNKQYRWDGSSWVAVQDTAIATAQTTANAAQTTANTALSNAATAYTTAQNSLQPSAYAIQNPTTKQLSSIDATGLTVYSGGSPTSGARVVLNSVGLAGYNSSGVATFSVSASTGDAIFKGNIAGASIIGSDLNISGNCIIKPTGELIATSATITGAVNATSGYFGTISNGFSINSTGMVGVGGGTIIGGTITTSSGSNQVRMVGSSNTLEFVYGGTTVGQIYPYSSGGIYFRYSTGGGPYMILGSGSVALYGDSSNSISVSSSGINTAGTITSAGDINLNSTNELRVPYAYSTTVTNAATVWISSTGQLRRSTASSQRYKTDIVDLTSVPELDPKALYSLPVRAFRFKDGYLSATDDRVDSLVPGFIAEEMDAIYPIAVDYTEGVETWNDRLLVPALLSLIQDLNNRIKELEGN